MIDFIISIGALLSSYILFNAKHFNSSSIFFILLINVILVLVYIEYYELSNLSKYIFWILEIILFSYYVFLIKRYMKE